MIKLLAYPLTVLYFLIFGLILVVFHPIQWIALNVFGYQAHKQSVSLLNLCIMRATHILGTTYRFKKTRDLPKTGPVIIVANHQSMYDIPPLIWHLRQYHPKFVSKKELGKGIPSVSYNLRHGGSVLINRKDRRQSLEAIGKLGRYIEKHNRGAVIFPEGTRSRDGAPKPFRTVGLETLMEQAPSAVILPVSINNSWKLLRYGKFPYGLGARMSFQVHPPIWPKDRNAESLSKIEAAVVKGIQQ